eukprot:647692-Rhodomonas_salina.2
MLRPTSMQKSPRIEPGADSEGLQRRTISPSSTPQMTSTKECRVDAEIKYARKMKGLGVFAGSNRAGSMFAGSNILGGSEEDASRLDDTVTLPHHRHNWARLHVLDKALRKHDVNHGRWTEKEHRLNTTETLQSCEITAGGQRKSINSTRPKPFNHAKIACTDQAPPQAAGLGTKSRSSVGLTGKKGLEERSA